MWECTIEEREREGLCGSESEQCVCALVKNGRKDWEDPNQNNVNMN